MFVWIRRMAHGFGLFLGRCMSHDLVCHSPETFLRYAYFASQGTACIVQVLQVSYLKGHPDITSLSIYHSHLIPRHNLPRYHLIYMLINRADACGVVNSPHTVVRWGCCGTLEPSTTKPTTHGPLSLEQPPTKNTTTTP
ncbi:hypothetical protein P691DRAFT_298299 [Macrolepiota fuliginosa MF-IS2]|uniref:Secreted protein n=1 Tax=Macrolepiota fuliginosa MF-IS2 TaxID=1400762 RepID=A0A9P5X530_9AGAR|nr:hypothetical protein P691DRAFT_298299 [Macrolepiota fuliginosa MF-IS2]